MAFSSFFRRGDENTRTCWGHSFQLTQEHPTAEDLEPLKYKVDTLADEALVRLNAISTPPQTFDKPSEAIGIKATDPISDKTTKLDDPAAQQPPQVSEEKASGRTASKPRVPKRDLYVLLRDNAASDPVLSKLWIELTTVPDWVDWDQIGRGQDVFYRYGGACLTGLAFQSLLGGLGATRVVETLTRTGGFSGPVIRHRLLETTQHVLQVTAGVSSLRPPSKSFPSAGDGFASTVRVRLLHAAVRARILALTNSTPGYYSTSRWGVPINDLDSLATILTFSATLLFLSLPRQGIWVTAQEAVDYTALWRYVAYLIGSPTEMLATPATSRRWMEAMLMHEIAPSKTSQILANNMIAGLSYQPPNQASPEFLCASARWLNGDELCDELGLPRPPAVYKMLVAGQCLFFMGVCYLNRSVGVFDRWKIEKLRKVFWEIIVEKKEVGLGGTTMFEFKHVPKLGKTTVASKRPWKGGEKAFTAEKRGAVTLAVVVGAVLVVVWFAQKVAREVMV